MSVGPIDIREPSRWQWAAALRPRTAADTDGEVRRLLEKLEVTGQDQMILRLVANSPNVFRPFVLMANSLVNQAQLPADVREAVVLHLATALQDEYEWHSHEREALAAGLSPEQVAGLAEPQSSTAAPDLLRDDQRLAIDLVESLRAGLGWSDQQWDTAVQTWGLEGTMDLMMSAAWWAGFVPIVLRAMRLTTQT